LHLKYDRLCNLRVTTIKTDVDLSKVKSSYEDFIVNDLSKYLNVESRNDVIVRAYLELAGKSFISLILHYLLFIILINKD